MNKKDLDLIRKDLSSYDRVREGLFELSRKAVRLSGSSILEIHRGDLQAAAETLKSVEKTLAEMEELARGYPEMLNTSSVTVARQEHVEAATMYSYVETGKIPRLGEMGGDYRSYMLGLLDVVGEFRRMSLNALRKGDVERAEALLRIMEGIYEDLQSLEHTSIIPTFRVKQDAVRKIIEATRGDVVTEVRRYSLEQALDRVGKRLSATENPRKK